MATQQFYQEPFSSNVDPPSGVIHPLVTYNPDTVELHPQLKSQDLRLKRKCVLCWSCWISFISVISAISIGFAVTIPSLMSSQPRYEPCIVVCCLVVVASISVGCLRKEGDRIALQNAAPSKKFICFFVTAIFLTVLVLVSVAISIYIFAHGEFFNCSMAKENNDENLENHPCSEEFEIRYVCSVLTIIFLTCIAALSAILLGLYVCVVYRFAYLKVQEAQEDVGKVIVTRTDKKGHKTIYAYTADDVQRLEPL